MNQYSKPILRKVKIPCRIIKRLYGSNADNAGDDILEIIHLVSEYRGQYRYRFDLDTTHPNPWYHSMIFEVEGMRDSAYQQFLEKLSAKGFINITS